MIGRIKPRLHVVLLLTSLLATVWLTQAVLAGNTLLLISVANSPPGITSVDAPGSVNLVVNDTTRVYCNASIVDLNGYQDVTQVNAALWYSSNSTFNSTDDYQRHYSTNCTVSWGTETVLRAVCGFDIQHLASSGAWKCNVTAVDKSNAVNHSTSLFTVNSLTAFSVSAHIAFGSMSPGNTSEQGIVTVVENTGNTLINLEVAAAGPLNCTHGRIPLNNIRYSASDVGYDSMCNLTESGSDTCSELKNRFNLQASTSIAGHPTNPSKNIYWHIRVPYGVYGDCSGTIAYTAKPA